MQKFKYCLLAILWPVLNCFAQPASSIRPLTVGDTVPDITLTNVYNYPVSKIQLSDLKGKLIILDFWGRYCVPCILALAKLDSLQQALGGQLQVITISDFTDTAELYRTLGKFKQTKKLRLPVLLKNELLQQYFPFTLVSHLVWIGENGVVKAITGGEWATAKNINELMTGKPVNWPVKKDVVDFDYKKPLLDYVQSKEGRPNSIYYSSLTSHMEGISAPNGTYVDSSRGVSVTLFYNSSILNLVQTALDYSGGASRGQFVLNVKDTNRYIPNTNRYYADWEKEHTYNYYLQLPIGFSAKETEAFIREDILRWLHVLGIKAEKKINHVKGKAKSQYIITEWKTMLTK